MLNIEYSMAFEPNIIIGNDKGITINDINAPGNLIASVKDAAKADKLTKLKVLNKSVRTTVNIQKPVT